MSKLFRVTVSYDVIVFAEDDADAYMVASSNQRDIAGDQEPDDISVWVGDIKSLSDIPEKWRGCIPYGGDGHMRVEEYLQPPKPEPREGWRAKGLEGRAFYWAYKVGQAHPTDDEFIVTSWGEYRERFPLPPEPPK